MIPHPLPLPDHYEPRRAGEIWRVPYQQRAEEAEAWAARHGIAPAFDDRRRVCLVAVDVQNTFCIPGGELFVAGRSGVAAVEDNRRLCEFIYRNLHCITRIVPTMDTHRLMPIFHALHLVDAEGNHPAPFTLVSVRDVDAGRWRFNERIAPSLGITPESGQAHLEHYVRSLAASGKYDLTVWPYHAMLGGIGHALASSVEEAIFFHSVARLSQPDFEVKGDNPLTEHYSVLGPEVTTDPDGRTIAGRNEKLIQALLDYDAVIIAGQAKSHCVAWTINDLLRSIDERGRALAQKVYLLEDCTSPVVIPGVIDYTDEADAAFRRFAEAGMHVVKSVVAPGKWTGFAV
jgi:nicotinamidase-related amidase